MVKRTTPRAHISLGLPQYGRPVKRKTVVVLEMIALVWQRLKSCNCDVSEPFKVQSMATSKTIIKISKHGEWLCCFYIHRDRRRVVLLNGSVIKPQQISCRSASNEVALVQVEYCAWPYAGIVTARQAVATGGDNYVKACETQAGEEERRGGGVDGSSFPPVSHHCMSHCSSIKLCVCHVMLMYKPWFYL